jgi:hypothetical protein
VRKNFADAAVFVFEYGLRKIWPKFRQRTINDFVKPCWFDFDDIFSAFAGVESCM